jgi:preprotein translocase subunit YajC
MTNEIVKLAASQGLWALLFVALLFYVLRQNEKRENSYQELLRSLSNSFETLKNDFCDIKDKINKFLN